MTKTGADRVLVIGATGFVGRALMSLLAGSDFQVVASSRNPTKARASARQYEWCFVDVEDEASIKNAMRGVQHLVFLYHGMRGGEGYEAREERAAERVAKSAKEAGVERIVYLGGVMPAENASAHLRSRAESGKTLASFGVSVFELRAPMIIGAKSESWRMTRDLAVRLPFVVDAPWTQSKMCPIDISSVAKALAGVLSCELSLAGIYELSGNEIVSAKDILVMAAELEGRKLKTLALPLPKSIARMGVKWLTRTHPHLGGELVKGLGDDLIPRGKSVFDIVDHTPEPLRVSMRRALHAEERERGLATQVFEGFIKRGDRFFGVRSD